MLPPRHTEDMNIQVPLLIAGLTATTGVGVGTIAANTGAISINELNALTSGVSVASDIQTPVDVLVPVIDGTTPPAPTVTSVDGTAAGTGADAGVSAGANDNQSSSTASSSAGNRAASTDGTSAGSTTAGGSYEDDDDEDEDHEDEDHEDDDDDDEDDD